MSDTKHNLLHLLKIITAPIFGALVIVTLILYGFSLILELAGFKIDYYWEDYLTNWWVKLP